MMAYRLLFGLLITSLFTACGDGALPTPKPRAYPRVEFPTRAYQSFDTSFCAFTFEYPVYAAIEQDTTYFDEAPVDPCWFNINIPALNGSIYFSYYPIGAGKDWETLRRDAFEMADWHNKRANYIDEILISRPGSVGGLAFDIRGPAASPFQFFLTDSTRHFLRGSLYFNTQARPDSLAPVIEFVKEDILHLIETFEWR